jgi:hypothetical protein
MFSRLGATLIGIPTGRTTDRVVIDVDPQHGGDIWLNKNKEAIPPTLTHSTPRGGFHLIFRNPPEMEIRNSQGRIASGVDVRGTGGYAIVPQAKVTRSNTMASRLTCRHGSLMRAAHPSDHQWHRYNKTSHRRPGVRHTDSKR